MTGCSSFAIDHGASANDNRSRPWTEEEDRILFTLGPAYGYGAVAERYLGRTERAGHRRFQKLNKE